MEYQAQLNEKYTPVSNCIYKFEVTFYKMLQETASSSSFISCCFTHQLLRQQISFFTNFSEFQSTLSEKNIFPQIFLFHRFMLILLW